MLLDFLLREANLTSALLSSTINRTSSGTDAFVPNFDLLAVDVKEVVMEVETSFGRWLQRRRKALDLTQEALAQRVACAAETLRKIEADARRPSRQMAERLAEALEIPEADRAAFIKAARTELAVDRLAHPTQDLPQIALIPPKTLSSEAVPFLLTQITSPSSKKLITNLPAPLTTFIGREKEQSDVMDLNTKHRLVTLTGSGGVGKTRLSLKVGEQLLGSYADGVWLVEFAPILDPQLVPRTIAIAIGLRDEPQRPVIDMLSDYMREKKILIILDNCEHLLDPCAQLVDTLLKRCPRLEIFATSREALGILGEAVYSVPSLELPDMQQLLEKLRDYESVRLFEERAQLARMDFSLTLENIASVAKICIRLDGIPLAIELAAARINIFSPEQIAARLQESFNLLTTGNRSALPRHQTLRAAIDWSYYLLSPAEQTLFRRLSVFVNGWTLEAVECICSDIHIKPELILDLLAQLINKSLVIRDEIEYRTRYRMLETIRQFAREKLMENEERQVFFQAHAIYFLKLAEKAEDQLITAEQVDWVNHLEVEYDNLRMALEWLMKTKNGNNALRLGGALGRFWHIHGRFREGREYLVKALEIGKCGDKKLQAKSLCWIGIFAYSQGEYAAAKEILNQSLTISQELESERVTADALYFIGVVNRIQGNYAKAREEFEEGLRLYYNLNDKHGIGNALINLGNTFHSQGNVARALELFEESLKIFRELGYKRGIAYASLNLAGITHSQQNVQVRQKFYEDSLLLSHELRDKWSVAYALSGLANILCAKQRYMKSARVQGVVTELLRELGTELEPFEEAEYNKTATALKAALGEKSYYEVFIMGTALSIDQAIELAIQND
jgi:predicted ATPase/transcriptional regulator with XRE-family HTH domain